VAIWGLKTDVDAIRIMPHANVDLLVWEKPKFSVCSQIKNHGHVKLNTSVVKFGKNWKPRFVRNFRLVSADKGRQAPLKVRSVAFFSICTTFRSHGSFTQT